MKKILTLALAICGLATHVFAQPATNPTTPPARTASQVISIYSAAYTNVAGTDFNPNWGQSGFGSATTFTLSGNEMRYYPNMNYQGIQIGSNQNVASLDSLHLDIWSSNCSEIDIFLVASGGAGEKAVRRTLALNTWNSINIKLSDYTVAPAAIALTSIFQFKFVTVTPASGANVYIDNIYFFTNATLPTLSNFSIPAKMLGDAPFSITAPTSNSSGAFTYTSSNTNVATISGSTITILKAGSSTITATQAAAGPYASGTITATLSVTVAPLSTNAPNPTKPAANVRSIFSNTYPNLPGTTFRTSWSNGGSALIDTAISGNNIKKYTGVDFVGIELASATDLSLADSVHISMWTPSAATFAIKLVNQGGGALNENIVWFDGNPGTHNKPAPLQGQWNVYSLPLSLFATLNGALRLTNRNAIFQILLVGAAPFGDNTYYIDNIYFSSSTSILPVDFKSFEVTKNGRAAQLTWMVANEINLKVYAVEKSANGKDFSVIATVDATATEKYNYTDNSLFSGVNYYRIKSLDKDGKTSYTDIKTVEYKSDKSLEIKAFPNPTKDVLNVLVEESNSSIRLINAEGKLVLQQNKLNVGNTQIRVSHLPKGIYTLSLTNSSNIKSTLVTIN